MTNDTESVPEDTHLNRSVQTWIEICVTLEDISIHWTAGSWVPSLVLIFRRNCQMASNKWEDVVDGPTDIPVRSETTTNKQTNKQTQRCAPTACYVYVCASRSPLPRHLAACPSLSSRQQNQFISVRFKREEKIK